MRRCFIHIIKHVLALFIFHSNAIYNFLALAFAISSRLFFKHLFKSLYKPFYITLSAIKTSPLLCWFICFALNWNWIPSDIQHYSYVLFLSFDLVNFGDEIFFSFCVALNFSILCIQYIAFYSVHYFACHGDFKTWSIVVLHFRCYNICPHSMPCYLSPPLLQRATNHFAYCTCNH